MSDLSELNKKELVALAESLELDADGTKADLISRIIEAQPPAPPVEEPVDEPVEEAPKSKPKAKGKSKLPSVDGDEDDEAFVNAAYLGALGREADAGGLAHYASCLSAGHLDRQGVLDDLCGSAEAQG